MRKSHVEEQDLAGYPGSRLPVRVLEDDGTTARVLTQRSGVHVRQDQIHTVPSEAVHDDR
jgi:hypothetical protein